jgi:hypothetical protein
MSQDDMDAVYGLMALKKMPLVHVYCMWVRVKWHEGGEVLLKSPGDGATGSWGAGLHSRGSGPKAYQLPYIGNRLVNV